MGTKMQAMAGLAVVVGLLLALAGADRAYHAGARRGLVVGYILAQHSTPPPNATPEDECRAECHRVHCDEWQACWSAPDPAKCQADVTHNEIECQHKRQIPKTMGATWPT